MDRSAETVTKAPRLALWLVALVVPHDDREAIVGDLLEALEDRGGDLQGARRWVWGQALLFLLTFGPHRLHLRPRATKAGVNPTPPSSGNAPRRFGVADGIVRVRQVVRGLWRDRRYALGVVVLLAIGIGPAGAMLSVVDKVLLRPLGYTDEHRLGLVRVDIGDMPAHPGATYSEIKALRATTAIFADVVASSREYEVSLGPPESMTPVSVAHVTPGLFALLGVTPAAGRGFIEEDLSSFTVIVSHHVWQTQYGADRALVGQSIIVNGREATVVGVLPRGFRLRLGKGTRATEIIDLWRPLRLPDRLMGWSNATIVRLADGVSFDQANAALVSFATGRAAAYPDIYGDSGLRYQVHPLLGDLTRESRPVVQAALVGVALLFVIAIANATALTLARLKKCELDFAVRSALGAGRWSHVRRVTAESLILVFVGALGGVGVAVLAIVGLQGVIPHTVPRWESITVDWSLVGYGGALALGGLLIVGLIPAWSVAVGRPWLILSRNSEHHGSARMTTRNVLVGTQIAMAVVLAFGALQLSRSARRLADTDLRFDPSGVLAFRVPLSGRTYEDHTARMQFFHQLQERLEALPGVGAVGAISHLPLSGRAAFASYAVNGADPKSLDAPVANYYSVVPGYFESLGFELQHGRWLTTRDNEDGRAVIVVDEGLAASAWPGEDPVGKVVDLEWRLPDAVVVGVAAHPLVRDVRQEVLPQIYLPYGFFPRGPQHFTVRTPDDPLALVGAVRRIVGELGPGRAMSGFQLLDDNVARATSDLRFISGLVAILAGSAALLAALGLFAVVSYVVHLGRRATAIRSALGATPARLLVYHLQRGSRVLLVAVPLGLVVALITARFLESLVYGVAIHDPVSLTAAALLAVGTGVVGTYLPARAATRVDPVEALRSE